MNRTWDAIHEIFFGRYDGGGDDGAAGAAGAARSGRRGVTIYPRDIPLMVPSHAVLFAPWTAYEKWVAISSFGAHIEKEMESQAAAAGITIEYGEVAR